MCHVRTPEDIGVLLHYCPCTDTQGMTQYLAQKAVYRLFSESDDTQFTEIFFDGQRTMLSCFDDHMF